MFYQCCRHCIPLFAAVDEEATKRCEVEGRIKQNGEKLDSDCVANILATHSYLFDPCKQQGGL